jgi:transcriptional regulator with XRE-family HTH domain
MSRQAGHGPAASSPQPAGGGSLAARIGQRLRARRRHLGLTLADTAERSGLSVSYLSAVEKGINLPSVQTLARIADALETNIPAVLAEEGANRVRVERLPEHAGAAHNLAHAELQLQAVALRSGPGDSATLALPTKDHDVFCYVVEGRLQVVLDGRDPVVLGAGDALDVRSVASIVWSSPGAALAVWTSCPMRV